MPNLRVLSWNCNAMSGRALTTARDWLSITADADVVLLQEPFAPSIRHIYERDPALIPKWENVAHSSIQPQLHRAYISAFAAVIILKSDLVVSSHRLRGEGRLVSVTVTAGGTELELTSVYAPAEAVQRKSFFESLTFARSRDGPIPIYGGDWNDAPSAQLDFLHARQVRNHHWPCIEPKAMMAKLHDVFALLHPEKHGFTRVMHTPARTTASRIDLFLVHQDLLAACQSVDVLQTLASDHSAILLRVDDSDGAIGAEPRNATRWTLPQRIATFSPFKTATSTFLADVTHDTIDPPRGTSVGQEYMHMVERCRAFAKRKSYELSNHARQTAEKIRALRIEIAEWPLDNFDHTKTAYQHKLEELRDHLALQTNRSQGRPKMAKSPASAASLPTDSVVRFYTDMFGARPEPPVVERARSMLLMTSPQTLREDTRGKLDTIFSVDSVSAAISASKPNHSAPGKNGLPHSFWRSNDDAVATMLTRLLNTLRSGRSLPTVHPLARGILLYKRGDAGNPANYRPLSIIDSDLRIMDSVMLARLQSAVSEVTPKTQCGFIAGRTSTEAAVVLHTVISSIQTGTADSSCAIIVDQDQQKAFDQMARSWIWQVMKHRNFPASFIRTLRTFYHHPHVEYDLGHTVCAPIPLERGVLQGMPTSSLIYVLVYQPFLDALMHDGIGVRVGDENTPPLTSISYADNSNIFLGDPSQLDLYNHRRAQYDTATGASLNPSTKYRILAAPDLRTHPEEQWPRGRIAESKIDPSTEWEYLGFHFHAEDKICTLSRERLVLRLQQRLAATAHKRQDLLTRVDTLNSQVLSILWHSMGVGFNPATLHQRIRAMVTPWLFSGQTRGWIPWETCTAPRQQGGLGLHDPESRSSSIQAAWLAKALLASKDESSPMSSFVHLIKSHLLDRCDGPLGVLLTRRSTKWTNARLDHDHAFVASVLQTAETFDLRLASTVNWEAIDPREAAALPWYLPEYQIENMAGIGGARYMHHIAAIRLQGFVTFADVLWVDHSSSKLGIPSMAEISIEDDRPRHHCPRFSETAARNVANAHAPTTTHTTLYWLASRWDRYWESLRRGLRDCLTSIVPSVPRRGALRSRLIPNPGDAVPPWEVMVLGNDPLHHISPKTAVHYWESKHAKRQPMPAWDRLPTRLPAETFWARIWARLHSVKIPEAQTIWITLLHEKTLRFRDTEFHVWRCACGERDSPRHGFATCPMIRQYWTHVWGIVKRAVTDVPVVMPSTAQDFFFGWHDLYERMTKEDKARLTCIHTVAVLSLDTARKKATAERDNHQQDTFRPISAAAVLHSHLTRLDVQQSTLFAGTRLKNGWGLDLPDLQGA
ncbi:uncharacterized protein PSFLO_03970 [Pseudozyma flocculosa]|nr:uncharacterized protein PSFLO_03970 [Pseudozyma flocculosa]